MLEKMSQRRNNVSMLEAAGKFTISQAIVAIENVANFKIVKNVHVQSIFHIILTIWDREKD